MRQAPPEKISFTKQLQTEWPVKEKTSPCWFQAILLCLRGYWAISFNGG